MNSLQSFNSVANDSWENNPLAPFFKGEFMIRQQYHSCPVCNAQLNNGNGIICDKNWERIWQADRAFAYQE